MFEHAAWQSDRMVLHDLVFRLEHHRQPNWDGGEHFRFFKLKGLIDSYEQFFARHRPRTKNIFEIGMWDGGSLAFWFELLAPQKLVGVDIQERADSQYFADYVKQRGLAERLRAYWGVDQADQHRLREIVAAEFGEKLDLVFDDASHLYAPTKASFEALFPLIRPGGFYVIEDWSWKHWDGFKPGKEWSQHDPPTRLAIELLEATGTAKGAIASVGIYPGFLTVERGQTELSKHGFSLQDLIYRQPRGGLPKRLLNRLLYGPERERLYRLKQSLKNYVR